MVSNPQRYVRQTVAPDKEVCVGPFQILKGMLDRVTTMDFKRCNYCEVSNPQRYVRQLSSADLSSADLSVSNPQRYVRQCLQKLISSKSQLFQILKGMLDSNLTPIGTYAHECFKSSKVCQIEFVLLGGKLFFQSASNPQRYVRQ